MNRLHIFADAQHPYEANFARYYDDAGLAGIDPQQWSEMSAEKFEQLQLQQLATEALQLLNSADNK